MLSYQNTVRRNKAGQHSISKEKKQVKSFKRRHPRWAVVTIGGLSTLLILSWLPTLLKRFWLHSASSFSLKRATMYLYFLSSFANPILYTIVNRDFCTFTIKYLRRLFGRNDQNNDLSMSRRDNTVMSGVSTRTQSLPDLKHDEPCLVNLKLKTFSSLAVFSDSTKIIIVN